MSADEDVLHELLERATDPEKETADELSRQMLCKLVRNKPHLVHKAQEMIITKIRSPNTEEAQRAITLLDECMTECGNDFLDEAGKFRFLNELIRLVSYKYQGSATRHEVKERIMECLMLWTTLFPDRPKIKEAYEMLHKEVGDHCAPSRPSIVMDKRESVLGQQDEDLFVKLLRSNDPENFKRANLLLRSRVQKTEARRNLAVQHKESLNEIENTATLLNQMLDTYDSTNIDGVETVHVLHTNCKRHYAVSKHLPELVDSHADVALHEEMLRVHKSLANVLERYKQVTSPAHSKSNAENNESSLDFLNGAPKLIENTEENVFTGVASTEKKDQKQTKDPYAELSEIFSSINFETESSEKTQQQQEELKPQQLPAYFESRSELLEPKAIGQPKPTGTNGVMKDAQAKGKTILPDIDSLSERLFDEILSSSERKSAFKPESNKLSLNDLLREQIFECVKGVSAEETSQSAENNDESEKQEVFAEKNRLKSAESLTENLENDESNILKDANVSFTKEPTNMVPLRLCDITVELDSVTPTGEQRILLDDEDIRIIIGFTKDQLSQQISVIVISAENKSKSFIKDFHFEASVKKPCKLRLLTADGSELPPQKPFRAAERINQIMLLLNTTYRPTDVSCIIGYKLGDDPDPIKEHFVAKDIPYVE